MFHSIAVNDSVNATVCVRKRKIRNRIRASRRSRERLRAYVTRFSVAPQARMKERGISPSLVALA